MVSSQDQPESVATPLVPLVRRLQDAGVLERGADGLSWVAALVARGPRTRDALRGTWLGHALHPLLTDFPLGTWTAASLLDLFGGRRSRPAAEGLLAFGVVTAAPTAVTGLAEWQATRGSARRVGVAHAVANSAAWALYGSSLVSRRRGRHTAGVVLGLAGGATAIVGGYLGGHLTLVDKVGTGSPDWYADPVEEQRFPT